MENNSAWDETLAEELVGKVVLIGLTFAFPDGRPEEYEQCFGRVASADKGAGIAVVLEGTRAGEPFSLPPDTRSIHRARPGAYRLRATGETVTNPDFTITFVVQTPEAS